MTGRQWRILLVVLLQLRWEVVVPRAKVTPSLLAPLFEKQCLSAPLPSLEIIRPSQSVTPSDSIKPEDGR